MYAHFTLNHHSSTIIPFIIVDLVTKSWSVSDCQLQSNTLLFNHWSGATQHNYHCHTNRKGITDIPWLTEFTSVVLGMGCGPGVQAVQLMRDLKSVLTNVDLPRPLSPKYTAYVGWNQRNDVQFVHLLTHYH